MRAEGYDHRRTIGGKYIFVMGMHRSGTSALTGLVQLLGADLGTHLLPPIGDNEKGYFENIPLMVLNDRILKELGSTWDSPIPLPVNWWNESSIQPFREELKSIITHEFCGELAAFKDPRLCRLFPFWKAVFSEMKIEYRCVISLRSPLEVAQSLKKRDGFSLEKSLLLWATYMFEAELYSRDCSRVFISFNQLLLETEKTVAHMEKAFDLGFPGLAGSSAGDAKEFLDPQLKHNHLPAQESGEERFEEIFQFYRILSGLTSGDAMEEGAFERIDRLRERFYRNRAVFYHDEILRQLAELTVERERAQKLEALIAIKDSLLMEKNQKIADLLNSRSWRFTAPFRRGIGVLGGLFKKWPASPNNH